MLSKISIEIKPQESQILKLYMPINAVIYQEENDYGDWTIIWDFVADKVLGQIYKN